MGTPTHKRNCQTGRWDICLAGQTDGICCPENSCDIDDGTRPIPLSFEPTCSTADLLKRCGDCGKFVSKDRWMSGKTPDGRNQHPLCDDCLSGYETIEYL